MTAFISRSEEIGHLPEIDHHQLLIVAGTLSPRHLSEVVSMYPDLRHQQVTALNS